jgi:hypothetical protein
MLVFGNLTDMRSKVWAGQTREWMTSRSRLTRELKLNPGLNHEIAGPRIWEPACRKPIDPVNTFTDEKSVEGGRPPLQT